MDASTSSGRSAVKGEKRAKPYLAFFLAGLAFAALAAGLITIDTRSDAGYRNLSNVSGTSIDTEEEVRIAGLTQIASQYRLRNGLSTLPSGAQFRVVWPNGSSEGGSVVNPFGSVGAVPVPGTQSSSDLAPPLPRPSKPV